MRLWTYQDLRTKVEMDLDLEEELFIQPDEMMGYCNEAIEEAEAEIIKINEDYFLTMAPIFLTQGRASYALPSNIYADKVRGFEYFNGPIYYPIKRFRDLQKFDRITDSQYLPSANQDYRWYLRHDSAASGQKMILVPSAQETTGTSFTVTIASPGVFSTTSAHALSVGDEVSFQTTGDLPTGLSPFVVYNVTSVPTPTTFQVSVVPGGADVVTSGTQSGVHTLEKSPFRVTLWYIRSANRMTQDSDILDIPQFASFILQFMKKRCYEKEPGNPNGDKAEVDLARLRKQMIDTLTERVPDNDDTVEMDMSHYFDHS